MTAAIEVSHKRRSAEFHPLTVAEVQPLCDDAVAIAFDVPYELRDAYAFVHGQHLTFRFIRAGREERRTYSICAPPSAQRLKVAVKRIEGGAFSADIVDALRPGDQLEVMTPAGSFTSVLEPAARKRYAALAAGSGITPILSIVATTLEVETGSEFTVVLGNRTSSSIMLLEELADLKNRYMDRLTVLHVLSREPQESDLLSGRIDAGKIDALTADALPTAEIDAWFLCGPFGLIESARTALREAGVEPARVHFELFHVDETAAESEQQARQQATADGTAATVEFSLGGRSSVVQLDSTAESVLDAALRVRPDMPYACKGGVCGTCRARVVEGEVRMKRDYALAPEDIAAGFVLTCQSHVVSPSAVLDYDA